MPSLTVSPDDRIGAPVRPRRSRKRGGAAGGGQRTAARGRGAGRKARAQRRRRPAPRWARPTLITAAIVLPVAAVVGVAYWSWQSGQVARALALGAEAIDRGVAGLGLTVAEVTVAGRQRTSAADVLAALGVARGASILAFDPEAARERLEALAWVRSASVSRRLPDTISVRLVERRPIARWQNKGRTALIDRDGVTITRRGLEAYRHLLKVVGPEAPREAARLIDMLRSEPDLAKRVTAATLVRGRRWDLRFAGGVEVRLPEEDAEAAWRLLARLEAEHRILSRDLIAIDLRVPERLMLRLGPDAAAARRARGKST